MISYLLNNIIAAYKPGYLSSIEKPSVESQGNMSLDSSSVSLKKSMGEGKNQNAPEVIQPISEVQITCLC